MTPAYIPKLRFAAQVSPWKPCFAYLPVQMIDKTWVWLQRYYVAMYSVYEYLDDPRPDFQVRTQ